MVTLLTHCYDNQSLGWFLVSQRWLEKTKVDEHDSEHLKWNEFDNGVKYLGDDLKFTVFGRKIGLIHKPGEKLELEAENLTLYVFQLLLNKILLLNLRESMLEQ